MEKLLSNTEVLSLAVKSSRRFELEKIQDYQPKKNSIDADHADNTVLFWLTHLNHLNATGGL